jgi:hypothetical protein
MYQLDIKGDDLNWQISALTVHILIMERLNIWLAQFSDRPDPSYKIWYLAALRVTYISAQLSPPSTCNCRLPCTYSCLRCKSTSSWCGPLFWYIVVFIAVRFQPLIFPVRIISINCIFDHFRSAWKTLFIFYLIKFITLTLQIARCLWLMTWLLHYWTGQTLFLKPNK